MKRFIIYIIVGIMAVACAEGDRDIVEPASDKITFRTVADMPQTRTALTSEGGKYRAIWKEGDTFKVAQIANGASTFSEGTVATDAERLSVLAQFDVVEASEYTYIFASPTISISSDATYFELTMPSQQLPPAMDTFDGAADLLISDAETTTAQPDGGSVDFNINRVSAIGKVTVKNLALSEGDSVQSVTFSCGKPVAGRMTNILLSDIVSGLDPLTNGNVIEADTAITTSLAEPQTGDFTYFFSCWPTTLAEGDSYTVMVTTTKGNYIKTATIPSSLTFTSGRMTTFTINMAGVALEVAGEEVDLSSYTDLSAEGTANCYLVQAAGRYKFKAVKGNSTEPVGDVGFTYVLWESYGTDIMPLSGNLIASTGYQDGYVYFSTPMSFKNGNSSIAVYDTNGTILWSWHIWSSAEGWNDHVYKNNAGTMMDRNLGATSATPGSVGALGLLYQWGRKDPFMGSSDISISTVAISLGTWKTVSGSQTVDYAIENPMTFIGGVEWCAGTGADDTDYTKRWMESEKTMYDPCPVGYRVPKGGESGFWSTALGTSSATSEGTTWDDTNKGRYWTLADGTTAWYPAVGNRNYGSGVLSNVGSHGFYWSASPLPSGSSTRNAHYMVFYDGNTTPAGSYSRGYGQSVRCVRDIEVVPEPDDPAARQILYTSTDGNVVTPNKTDVFGANIVSNTYENGQGVITFDGKVIQIGENAFDKCGTLSSVTIPNSVTLLGKDAFIYCNALTEVEIPQSVTEIVHNPFRSCNNLSKFSGKFASADGRCLVADGVLKSFAFVGLEEYVIEGEGIVEIGSGSFYACTALKSITIPNSVTTISGYSFESCSALTTVTIPESVTTIAGYSFPHCTSLVSVYCKPTTPPTLLGDDAFINNAPNRKIYVPATSVEAYKTANGWSTYADAIVEEDKHANNQIFYTSTDGNIVTPYNADAFGVVIVSNTYENGQGTITFDAPVISIGNYAFRYCTSLASVTIPDSVTTIGNYAFSGCSGLTAVTIGNGVTEIGGDAFSGCSGLTAVTIGNGVTKIGNYAFSGCSGLTAVTIGNGVTEIGSYAFRGCTSLASITIPDSVTSIGSSAFRDCSNLTSVTIGNGVTSIGSYAFYNCSSITSVTIGNSVTSIGGSVFYNCSNLKDVYCTGDISAWCKISFERYDANPLHYGAKLYIDNKEVTEVTIPSDVTEIKDYAFFKCSSLTSVTISDSVTTIGNSAFSGCSGLTAVTIGNGVTEIGNSTFWGCTSLASITIPDSVTTIGDRAFSDCRSLTSITIPDSVTTIGSSAFYNCSSLTSITIPDRVTTIGESTFSNCSSLTSVTIPDSVTKIGSSAFYSCSGLTAVTIGNGVTEIGMYAFYNCESLSRVYCKRATPPTLGGAAFDKNAADRKIYVPAASVNAYKTANGWNTYADAIVAEEGSSDENRKIYYTSTDGNVVTPYNADAFGVVIVSNTYENGQGTITFDAPVISIGYYAFSNCTSLASVTIPDSVTSIGSYAFSNCTNLTSITIPDSVTEIGYYAFSKCSSLTSVTIPDSVTTIGNYAFENCSNLVSVYCKPATPPTLGTAVFDGNAADRKIYVPATSVEAYRTAYGWNTYADAIVAEEGSSDENRKIYYTSTDGNVVTPNKTDVFGANIVSNTYENGQGVITFDGEVTQIGDNAFYNLETLLGITIPDSVTEIGEYAFRNCKNLATVTIPDGVTLIKYGSFDGCSGLTSATIGSSVTSLGDYAFYNCSSLVSVYCKPTIPPTLGNYVFFWNAENRKIYVPAAFVEAYKTANGWNAYADAIVADSDNGDVDLSLYADLSAEGTANCYLVQAAGNYKFKAVKGNSTESVGAAQNANVLWETFGTSTTPNVGDLVVDAGYKDDYIYFSTNATFNNGNASIAVYDANGTILWSWHIWYSAEGWSNHVYKNNAGTMMDRNLGATSATPGSVGALGLLYQWGRKDPFLSSSSISTNTDAASTITFPSAVTSTSATGTIEYATSNPTTFIITNTINYDWYYTGYSSTDDTRWMQYWKTMYDPCPVGYRVPKGGESGFWATALGTSSSTSEGTTWDDTNKGRHWTLADGTTAWYPAVDCRNGASGTLLSVGSYGYYWSASPYPSSSRAYDWDFNDGCVYLASFNYRSFGCSVRCVRE